MNEKGILPSFTLGEIDISGFTYDTVYELKELLPPAGYVITNSSVYFKAVHEKQNVFALNRSEWHILTDENNNPVFDNDSAAVSENWLAISIKNEPGVALPKTGGPGTRFFTILGSILTLGAGVLLLRRRRLM